MKQSVIINISNPYIAGLYVTDVSFENNNDVDQYNWWNVGCVQLLDIQIDSDDCLPYVRYEIPQVYLS